MTVGLDNIGNFSGLVHFHLADRDVGCALDDADLAVQFDGESRFRHVHGHGLAGRWRAERVAGPKGPHTCNTLLHQFPRGVMRLPCR